MLRGVNPRHSGTAHLGKISMNNGRSALLFAAAGLSSVHSGEPAVGHPPQAILVHRRDAQLLYRKDRSSYSRPAGGYIALANIKSAIKRIRHEGAEPEPTTPQEYAADIDREETRWSAVVKELKLVGE